MSLLRDSFLFCIDYLTENLSILYNDPDYTTSQYSLLVMIFVSLKMSSISLETVRVLLRTMHREICFTIEGVRLN